MTNNINKQSFFKSLQAGKLGLQFSNLTKNELINLTEIINDQNSPYKSIHVKFLPIANLTEQQCIDIFNSINVQSKTALHLEFDTTKMSENICLAIKNLFLQQRCPDDFQLSIIGGTYGQLLAATIAAILNYDKLPKKLHFNLSRNLICSVDVSKIAYALAQAKFHPGLIINLSGNKIEKTGALAFANAVETLPKTHYFSLNLNSNPLTIDGTAPLLDSIKAGHWPAFSTLELSNLNLKAMDKLTDKLSQMLAAPDCPANFKISLLGSEIQDYQLEKIIKAITPQYFTGNFFLSFTTHNSAFVKLTNVLKTGSFPSGNTFHIECTDDLDLTSLIDAFASPKCPENLTLILKNNKINDTNFIALTNMLEKGRYPKKLTLNLQYNYMSDLSATKLIDALKGNTDCVIKCSDQLSELSADNKKDLQLLYQRNLLIRRYPGLASLIKAACHKAGLYRSDKIFYQPLTLFQQSVRFIYSSSNNFVKQTVSLPEEVQEFFSLLKEIENKLNRDERPGFIPCFGLIDNIKTNETNSANESNCKIARM